MNNDRSQKTSLILSLILAGIFGICFSYRAWQLCCGGFSSWSLLNPISFLSFFESALFGFIVFFIIVGSRFHVALQLFYTSYVTIIILIDSPYRFYFTALAMLVAVGHLLYVFLVEKNQKFDVLILAFLTLVTFAFFPWASPFHFDEKFIADARTINSNVIALQPVYKGFIAAKFLNFSAIDYSDYAAAIGVPAGDKSFLIQVLAYMLDLPSISTASFFYLIDMLGLCLIVFGSFCTYLLFKKYLKASSVISIMAAMLLFPLNKVLITLYTFDNWLFITCYSILPLAIMAGIGVINREKNSILICAFTLSLPFLLISVHPNYYIILVAAFFAVMVLLAAEQSQNFREFIGKIARVGAAILISLLFSAYYLLPIIEKYLTWNCHVIPHNSAHCYRHCNKEIFIAVFALLATAYVSIKKKKIVIGVYFSAAALVVCYMMKKTLLMDFVMVKISGGINDRFTMLLWFLSCFMVLYYARNLCHKSLNFILILISVGGFSYFTYAYSPSFSAIFYPKQSYHIFLKAELANYPALSGDKSNANYIKEKILKYEKDFDQEGVFEKIKDAKSGDEIIKIANAAADVIDNSYAEKVNNFDGQKFRAAISTYNTSMIYRGLKPFSRIESSVGHDFHIGSGPGLLLNNSSTSFDPRYMVGHIPTEFLYVAKNYEDIHHKGDGGGSSYNSLPWVNFNSEHPKTKHMMNVSGVDYVTSNRNLGLKKINSFNLFGSTYHLYQNPSSYGVSYIANVKNNSSQEDVVAMKNVVKDYVGDKISYKDYEDGIKKFEQQIFALHNKYDAIVEDNSDMKNNSGQGVSEIKNIIGNIIITRSTCQNKDCILALNFAHFPQWKAFRPDFSELKIYDVNLAFMGVRLGSGVHEVMFIYLSYLDEVCIILSLMMVALLILGIKINLKNPFL